jgi:hypothetical protein
LIVLLLLLLLLRPLSRVALPLLLPVSSSRTISTDLIDSRIFEDSDVSLIIRDRRGVRRMLPPPPPIRSLLSCCLQRRRRNNSTGNHHRLVVVVVRQRRVCLVGIMPPPPPPEKQQKQCPISLGRGVEELVSLMLIMLIQKRRLHRHAALGVLPFEFTFAARRPATSTSSMT